RCTAQPHEEVEHRVPRVLALEPERLRRAVRGEGKRRRGPEARRPKVSQNLLPGPRDAGVERGSDVRAVGIGPQVLRLGDRRTAVVIQPTAIGQLEAEDVLQVGIEAYTDDEVYRLAMLAYGSKSIANELQCRRRQTEYDKHKLSS